jgi:hypothetical protein
MRLFNVAPGNLQKSAPSSFLKWFLVFSLGFIPGLQSAEAAGVIEKQSINPDCSAFKKEPDGKWIATQHSEITGSVSGPEPIYPGLNLDMMRPNGFNLVDALNQKCEQAKHPS